MNRTLTLAALVLALTAWMAADVADAKRLGGGRSLGAQRQMTPTPAPSAPSASPSAPSAASPSMAPRTAPAAAPSGASRWLGPIAGIAGAIGLAALLSHFGLSETFASFLLIALAVVAILVVVRLLLARRSPQPAMQYSGTGRDRVEPQMTRTAPAFEPVMGGTRAAAAPAAAATPSGRFPPGFDAAAFAEQAKQQFRRLQAAYDNGDRAALADVMTPDMLAEVTGDLAKRASHDATAIDRLDAEILEVATEGRQHWMSVRFTGELREDGALLPKPFEEVWNLVKPVDDSSGWMLAGIQQAHEMA
ncbi:MAG: Tim44-like domain-containing protein [Burkholderiales bacterium]